MSSVYKCPYWRVSVPGKVEVCSECGTLIFRRCVKYLICHRRYLTQELGDLSGFYRRDDPVYRTPCVWGIRDSESVRLVKSACVSYALRVWRPVRVMGFNELVQFTLNKEQVFDFTHSVYYLDLATGSSMMSQEKMRSIIVSFIDLCLSRGIHVFCNTDIPLVIRGDFSLVGDDPTLVKFCSGLTGEDRSPLAQVLNLSKEDQARFNALWLADHPGDSNIPFPVSHSAAGGGYVKKDSRLEESARNRRAAIAAGAKSFRSELDPDSSNNIEDL